MWDEIDHAAVKKAYGGKDVFYKFIYKARGNDEKSMRMDNFNISPENLRVLLQYYHQKSINPQYSYLELINATRTKI